MIPNLLANQRWSNMRKNQIFAENSRLSRRQVLMAGGAIAALAVAARPVSLFAQEKLKVAAIYTVPVEQQWVSRIHKAANAAKERGDIEYVFSENVANTDYERVMREYCEAGNKLIVGEVFGVEDAARAVAKDYPDIAFLMGSSFKPDDAVPNFSRVRQLHPGCVLPDRPDRRRDDQVEEDRHGRRLSDPRGQPADERLHGRREGDHARTPSSRSPSSAPGSTRPRPRKRRSRRSTAAPTCSMPSASASPTRPRSAASWPSATSSTPRPTIPTRSSPPPSGTSSRRSTRRIAEVKAGTFKADDYGVYSFMKEGGCSLAPLGTFEGKVPAEVMAKVAEKEKAIKDGTFTVEIDDSEPKSS